MKRVKIGYVSMIQLNFRGDKEWVRNQSIEDLRALSQTLDFDLYIHPGFVVTPDEAETAANALEAEQVDLALCQNTSFCSGYLIQRLARVRAAIGLWAVPETTETGPMPLNSFCGINLGAALITHYLKAYPIRYKWFYGYKESDLLTERLRLTVDALRAVKNLRGARVALIGGIAPGFDNFYDDERLIEARFGVRVDRLVEFADIERRANAYAQSELAPYIDTITADASHITPKGREGLEKYARMHKAYEDLAREGNYAALASTCWPRPRAQMGMVSCAAFARLNDAGIPTACEGDVLTAVSMLALQHIAGDTPTHMDLSEFHEADETVLLWHCGIGSKFYAKGGKVGVEEHFNPGPNDPVKGWLIQTPVTTMEFAPMRATVMRFTDECKRMFLMGGDFIDEKQSHDGSRGWMGNLRFNGEPIALRDLLNTILTNGFHHHYPLVRGDVTAALKELCYWLDLELLPKVPYAAHNSPKGAF